MTPLYVDLETGRLCAVRVASVHETGRAIRDLLSGLVTRVPSDALEPIDDADVGTSIAASGVRGTLQPYRCPPKMYRHEIPLHGNLRDPMWASLCLGGQCNSRCSFCYTEWIRGAREISADQARDALERIAEIGSVRTIVFSGGEATLRSELPDLIGFAKLLGFREIGLQTNARALAQADVAQRLITAGLTTALVSLHGPQARIHDSITCRPGSFAEALEGIANLRRLQATVTINFVICRQNFESLPDFVELVVRNRISESVRLSYVIVEGAAYDRVKKTLVGFGRLLPFLKRAMLLAASSGLRVQLANMPPCVARQAFSSGADLDLDASAQRGLIEVSPFYRDNVARGEQMIKFEQCGKCAAVAHCRGIQIEYLRLFPESRSEFAPV